MKENKTYSFDEAFEASLRYFDGDELAARVWVNKYAMKDSFCNIYEKSPEDMHWRIANEMPEQPDRLPIESILHEETYTDYTAESIDLYYKVKESLKENKHFVEINHTETLAQIFTDIRYKKSDNEVMSKNLLDALKQQEFI